MECGLDSVKTMTDKPQLQEVFMGRLAVFWGGMLAGAVALGAACLLIPDNANREIDRGESDDDCLSAETTENADSNANTSDGMDALRNVSPALAAGCGFQDARGNGEADSTPPCTSM